MIMPFLRSTLGAKLVPVTIVVILALTAAAGLMSKLYISKVGEVAELNLTISDKNTKIDKLTGQLTLEREAIASIRSAKDKLDKKYESLKDEIDDLETDEECGSIDRDALVDFMCRNGMADPNACAAANSTIIN